MTREGPASAYTRGAIALRVILSSLIAATIACFALFVVERIPLLANAANSGQSRDGVALLIEVVTQFLAAIPLVMVLASPLIAFAVGLGLVFRNSIARHLAAWCIATPFILYPVVSAYLALVPEGHGSTATYLERLTELLTGSAGLYRLLETVPGALAFYVLSRHAERRAAASMA